MEKKLGKITAQVDTFLSSKKLHTSLSIIKITAALEEGRQILQQAEIDLKCKSSATQAAQLKSQLSHFNTVFTR